MIRKHRTLVYSLLSLLLILALYHGGTYSYWENISHTVNSQGSKTTLKIGHYTYGISKPIGVLEWNEKHNQYTAGDIVLKDNVYYYIYMNQSWYSNIDPSNIKIDRWNHPYKEVSLSHNFNMIYERMNFVEFKNKLYMADNSGASNNWPNASSNWWDLGSIRDLEWSKEKSYPSFDILDIINNTIDYNSRNKLLAQSVVMYRGNLYIAHKSSESLQGYDKNGTPGNNVKWSQLQSLSYDPYTTYRNDMNSQRFKNTYVIKNNKEGQPQLYRLVKTTNQRGSRLIEPGLDENIWESVK